MRGNIGRFVEGCLETPARQADCIWDEVLREMRVLQTGKWTLTGLFLALAFHASFAEFETTQWVFYPLLICLAALSAVSPSPRSRCAVQSSTCGSSRRSCGSRMATSARGVRPSLSSAGWREVEESGRIIERVQQCVARIGEGGRNVVHAQSDAIRGAGSGQATLTRSGRVFMRLTADGHAGWQN